MQGWGEGGYYLAANAKVPRRWDPMTLATYKHDHFLLERSDKNIYSFAVI